MKSLIIGSLTILIQQTWAAKEWQSCETIDVDQFDPKIIWDHGLLDASLPKAHVRFSGTLEAISDYRNPEQSKRFDLRLLKYEPIQGTNMKSHFIVLPGGPGNSMELAKVFPLIFSHTPKLDGTVYYGISYRGYGQFAHFVAQQEEPGSLPDLETIIKQGPFPLKDLTMENAARDVAMVIRAIQRSAGWQKGDKIFLYGV